MLSTNFSRRVLLGGLAGTATLTAVTACGTAGPGDTSGDGGETATMWNLSGQPNEDIYADSVTAFNELGEGTVKQTYFQNDAYKQKIRTAIGAGEAPTIIYGWGGGTLRTYAEAEQVEDLTSWFEEESATKERHPHRRDPAHHHVQQQDRARGHRRHRPRDLGRTPRRHREGTLRRSRPDLPGRTVALDLDDVARVPVGPHRRSGRVRLDRRR
jgi:hypothetical protein